MMRKKVCSDILPHFVHCLTKNLTLRSTRTTPSGIIVAFSTIPPLHQFPFAETTGPPPNALSRVTFLPSHSGGKSLPRRTSHPNHPAATAATPDHPTRS